MIDIKTLKCNIFVDFEYKYIVDLRKISILLNLRLFRWHVCDK